MDDQRFDALVKALVTGTSRRRLLRGLGGSVMAGTLSLVGRGRLHAQEDDCPEKVGICHRTASRRRPFVFIEVCADAVSDHAAHGDLVACSGAGIIDPDACTCVCPLTETDCPGGVDTASCACQEGTGCAASTTLCGTTCVDLSTDPANCGSCGNRCVGSGACENGSCCATGTCGSLTCPATADSCTGTGISCGSGDVSCYCTVVPDGAGGTASVCGSRTGCFDNLQGCTPGNQCTYSTDENGVSTYGMCISCGGCIRCFKQCTV